MAVFMIIKWQDYFSEMPPFADDWIDFGNAVARGESWDDLILEMRVRFIEWTAGVEVVHELLNYALQVYWQNEYNDEILREYWREQY